MCSCGIGTYSNPKGSPAALAVIKSTIVGPMLVASEMYTVHSIDGEEIYYGASWSEETKKLLLTPGMHQIRVKVVGRRGMFPHLGHTTLSFIAKPGKTYVVTGRRQGITSQVWIEEKSTREKVSRVASVVLRLPPPRPVIYVPIAQ